MITFFSGCGESQANEQTPMGIPDASGMTNKGPSDGSSVDFEFNWLSHSGLDLGQDDHPLTSPICGWLLLNYLEGSIEVFSEKGKPLGAVNSPWGWRPTPGASNTVEEIENIPLRRLVNWMIDRVQEEESFISSFSERLSGIIEKIDRLDPENTFNHSTSVLINKPLALVQSILKSDVPPTDNIEISFQVGGSSNENDGLVAYWMMDKDSKDYWDNSCYFNQVTEEQVLSVKQDTGADQAEIRFSMLVKPKGSIYGGLNGLAPKKLQLSPDLYLNSLKAIEVSFLSAPILRSDSTKMNYPLLKEGDKWQWDTLNR